MIGLFDSGVGGLTILQAIRKVLPSVNITYLADTKNFPYGPKDHVDICNFSVAAAKQLMSYSPDVIVVACNTASTSALGEVRGELPNFPVIGVVPVLKTVSTISKNKRVAVLATEGTFNSLSYAELKKEYIPGFVCLELALPNWVEFIEQGQYSSPEAKASVQVVANKVKEFQADTVALSCTHFPFLKPMLAEFLPGVHILDSGEAVARHVERVLQTISAPKEESGQTTFLVTGNSKKFSAVASALLGEKIQATNP